MFIILWQYTVNPQRRNEFIEYYHATGKWTTFFSQATEYIGTDFFQTEEDQNQFVTIDKWMSKESYEQFLNDHQQAYQDLDKHCEGLTIQENLVGKFFMLE